jgi:hypothetical protein
VATILLPTAPPVSPAGTTLQLVFEPGDGDLAALIDRPVWIGTASSRVDNDGFAPFTLAQLAEAGEDWVLRVGDDQEAWQPLT